MEGRARRSRRRIIAPAVILYAELAAVPAGLVRACGDGLSHDRHREERVE